MTGIYVDNISEATSANGVSIDGLKVKDYSLMYGSNIGITVDSSGHVLKPNQPAFCVRGSGDWDIPVGSWTKIPFSTHSVTHLFDTGGDFDESNNLFDCPVSGVYQFTIDLSFNNPSSQPDYYGIQISAGGTTKSFFAMLQDFGQFNGDPAYWSSGGTIILDLTAGDDVFWNFIQAGTASGSDKIRMDDSYWSGHLIG